jgi:predicted transcriptional regulator
MKRNVKNSTFTSLYLRASWDLDRLVEEMGRAERRTKTAVLTLAIEQYASTHHPDLYARYEEEAA